MFSPEFIEDLCNDAKTEEVRIRICETAKREHDRLSILIGDIRDYQSRLDEVIRKTDG